MPATPSRAQFIRQEFRSVTNGPVSSVVAAYGESARRTTEPIETFFVHQADAQAKCDERMVLLSASRRQMTQTINGEATGLGLSYTSGSPSVQVIDDERAINHAALVSEIIISFADEATTIQSWGGT